MQVYLKTPLFLIITVCLTFLIGTPVFSQSNQHQSDIENILFDNVTNRLQNAIMYASNKQALYSYNIANSSTAGFDPILTEDEQKELNALLPNKELNRDVMMEFLLSKMTNNRLKHAAFINLQKKKFEIIRQVASMGKK